MCKGQGGFGKCSINWICRPIALWVVPKAYPICDWILFCPALAEWLCLITHLSPLRDMEDDDTFSAMWSWGLNYKKQCDQHGVKSFLEPCEGLDLQLPSGTQSGYLFFSSAMTNT